MGTLVLKAIHVALAALSAIVLSVPARAQLLHESPPAVLEAKRDERPKIAIVIDDLGLDWARFRTANRLPMPVTLAFLPYGEDSQAMLDNADPRHEPILHLPMEPFRRKEDAGPGMVPLGTPTAVRVAMHDNLGKISGYRGVNNHTGSRVTASTSAMATVLAELASRDLYFLDSRTTPDSKAAEVGRAAGALVIEGDLFLDGDFGAGGAAHVTRQLETLAAVAERNGEAVGIGHPYPATMSVVAAWAVDNRDRFRFVTTGDLAADRSARKNTGY